MHTTVLRLAIFFIGSIAVMAALIPWHQAGVDTSPFVLVFQSIGMPFAGDIMNFVVLTAVLSAANSGLYVCSRMVWSLAQGRHDSARVRQNELPWRAGVRRDVQHGRLAAGAAVFRGRRLDRVPGAGRGFRPGHAGGVVVGIRLPYAIPPPMAREGTYAMASSGIARLATRACRSPRS